MDAAVFIVMHLSRTSISDFLFHKLGPLTGLKCEIAAEGASIEKGYISIAVPNLHLLVKKNKIILGRGPEENRWRPSIDILFRSAAAAYSSRTIGVGLTGLLDDGTSGMHTIKRSGGTCIVQDPNWAEFPHMPLSVLNNMHVDYSIVLADMGEVIESITQTNPKEEAPPEDVFIASEIAGRVVVAYENVKQPGEKNYIRLP